VKEEETSSSEESSVSKDDPASGKDKNKKGGKQRTGTTLSQLHIANNLSFDILDRRKKDNVSANAAPSQVTILARPKETGTDGVIKAQPVTSPPSTGTTSTSTSTPASVSSTTATPSAVVTPTAPLNDSQSKKTKPPSRQSSSSNIAGSLAAPSTIEPQSPAADVRQSKWRLN